MAATATKRLHVICLVFCVVSVQSAWGQAQPSNALFVMERDGSQVRRVLVIEALGQLGSPRWSHDGSRLTLEGRSSRLSRALIVDATGKNLLDLGAGIRPDWSPDDKQIVCEMTGVGPSVVWVQNADGKGSSWLCVGSMPRWSPDGSQLAVLAPLRIMDLVTGNLRALFTADDNVQDTLAYDWSPDGRRMAVVIQRNGQPPGQRELLILNLTDPAGGKSTRLPGPLVGAPAWSPDGKLLAVALEQAGQGRLHLLEVEGQGPAIPIPDQQGDNRDPDWSPDGKRLAFVSTRVKP